MSSPSIIPALRPDGPGQGPPSSSDRSEKLADTTRQFEAYIIRMLLKEMRKGVNESGLFKDRSMEGYNAILDDAIAKRAAEAGSFGLAKQMLEQLETMR